MAEPFLGQIIQVGFNFAPQGYAKCDGQLMSIAQNTALFALLGTTFGGDGITTFALPNLDGRIPMHMGQGPGLSNQVIGEIDGTENVTLIYNQIPLHNHSLNAFGTAGDNQFPAGNLLAGGADNTQQIYTNANPNATLDMRSVGLTGGNLPHNNMMPFLVNNFSIALEGIFPSRN
jgi:microcystin-dependent protein